MTVDWDRAGLQCFALLINVDYDVDYSDVEREQEVIKLHLFDFENRDAYYDSRFLV